MSVDRPTWRRVRRRRRDRDGARPTGPTAARAAGRRGLGVSGFV